MDKNLLLQEGSFVPAAPKMRTVTFDAAVYKLAPVEPAYAMMDGAFDDIRTSDVHTEYGVTEHVWDYMLKHVPADLPDVVTHSGKPEAWWDKSVGGFYMSLTSIPKTVMDRGAIAELFTHPPAQPDTAMFNAMLIEASRIDGAMPVQQDIEALQARIAELESLNTQLRNLAYERTGMTFTAINDGVFIDGFGLLPVGSIEKWESLLAALESQLAAQDGQDFVECRYKGYKNEPLPTDATNQMKAAWLVGLYAREPNNWLPIPENINALPGGIRDYVHNIETLCDPSGMVAENTLLRDQTSMLDAMIGRLKQEIEAQAGQEHSKFGNVELQSMIIARAIEEGREIAIVRAALETAAVIGDAASESPLNNDDERSAYGIYAEEIRTIDPQTILDGMTK